LKLKGSKGLKGSGAILRGRDEKTFTVIPGPPRNAVEPGMTALLISRENFNAAPLP
jgi:hypothetical protein